jgi:hypothetical protein
VLSAPAKGQAGAQRGGRFRHASRPRTRSAAAALPDGATGAAS